MTSKNRTPRRIGTAALLAVAASSTPALAQSSSGFIAPYDETIAITLGGIVNRFDTNVRFDSTTHNTGTDFKLEDNLLESNLSSFEAGLSWRFLRAHRLDFDYYRANRSGSRTYTTEIDIGDTVYPLGAKVDASAKTQLFIVDYRWSFVQRPTYEWSLILGIYGGQLEYDLDAIGGVGVGGATVTRETHKTVSTTVPLPMIGVGMDWYPHPQWRAGASAMGVKAKIGDVDGHAYRIGAYGEYMIWRNWGVGARYSYVDINANVTKDDWNGSLGWRTNSVSLYAKAVW